MLLDNYKKESPIIGVAGMGGGINSYIFLSSGGDYEISRSLRFDSGSSAYLSRSVGSAGNRKTWTWAGWVKRAKIGTYQNIFGTNSSTGLYFQFVSDDTFQVMDYTGSTSNYRLITNQVFRDVGAWMHILVALDTSLAAPYEDDRIKIYVNGTQITSFQTRVNPQEDYQGVVNTATVHTLGRLDAQYYCDLYLADVHFIDGQALAPTDFGETDSDGVWQPKKFAGTYGTNGFHLDFKDNSSDASLGYDAAGSNNWDVYSLTAGFSPSSYDSSQNWPTSLTFSASSGGFLSGRAPGDVCFDGTRIENAATTSTGSGSYIEVSGLNLTSSDTLEVMLLTSSPGNLTWEITGTNLTTKAITTDATQFVSIPVTGSANTFRATSTSGARGHLTAIRINGKELITPVVYADIDSLRDSPSQIANQTDSGSGGDVIGNFATLNPLDNSQTLSNGNLDVTGISGNWRSTRGTIGISSGKYYWEWSIGFTHSGTNQSLLGIAQASAVLSSNYASVGAYGWEYYSNAEKFHNGSNTSYGASYTSGDVIGVAFDADNGTLTFYKNGSTQGQAYSGLTSGPYFLTASLYGTSLVSLNAGQRDFSHAVPSGYKSLNTANLSTPTIADGSQYFDTKVWNGDDASSRTIPTAFDPDLVWVKNRGVNGRSHYLYDAVRGFGANKELVSNSDVEEGSDNHLTQNHGYVSGTTATGFTLAAGATNSTYTNDSGNSYVGWAWDAGTSTVLNEVGSIDSQVRAQPSAGFSICTFTKAASTAQTWGHGLNAAPSFIITRERNQTRNWIVWHKDLSLDDNIVYLNLTNAESNHPTLISSPPSSSIVSMGTGFGGGNHIAYCFAPVAGYSAFGSYTGNGSSSNGPFVFTGFSPRWILIKRAVGGSANWCIYDSARDTFNDATHVLSPDTSGGGNVNDAFVSAVSIDFLSNGFRIVDVDGEINANTNTYIYAAFASHPFKSARAR